MSQSSRMIAAPVARWGWPSASLPLGMPREWGWVLVVMAIDVAWSWALGMRFTDGWLHPLAIAGLLGLAAVCRPWECSRRLADALEINALWIGFSVTGCVLTYLFATSSLPLQDATFDRLDVAIGFDWLGWKHFVDAHPPLRWLLAHAYSSLRLQMFVAATYFAFAERQDRNRELFRAAFITLMVTTVVFGFAPALSAFVLHGLPERAPWLHDLTALRAGERSFSLLHLQGIVEMPSYHAIMAVLLVWSFRRTGWLGIAVAVWNVVMLVSVLSEGGHYLVAVIAGLAIAFTVIWLLRDRTAGASPGCAHRPNRGAMGVAG